MGAVEEILAVYERTGRAPALTGSVRELTEAVEAAYRLWRGRPPGHPEFSVFRSWAELEDLVRLYPRAASAYRRYVRFVERYRDEVPRLCRRLEENVREDDGRADLTVSTVHRAKGRQWEAVRLGQDFEDVTLATPDGRVVVEEVNLAYVAVTRAVHELDPGPLAGRAPDRPPAVRGLLPGAARRAGGPGGGLRGRRSRAGGRRPRPCGRRPRRRSSRAGRRMRPRPGG